MPSAVSIHEPLHRNNAPAFATLYQVTKNTKDKDKKTVLKADRNVLPRLKLCPSHRIKVYGLSWLTMPVTQAWSIALGETIRHWKRQCISIDMTVRKTSCLCSLLLILAHWSIHAGSVIKLWSGAMMPCSDHDCDHWYHVPCMNMTPEVYKAVAEHSSLTWICCNCSTCSSSKSLLYVTFRHKRSFKWSCSTM